MALSYQAIHALEDTSKLYTQIAVDGIEYKALSRLQVQDPIDNHIAVGRNHSTDGRHKPASGKQSIIAVQVSRRLGHRPR